MRRRTSTVLLAVVSAAAIVAVPGAFAAYTTSKLEVRQAGAVTHFRATQNANDDATASARIFVPSGTTLTTTQAPGTVLGPVRALVKALALAGADLPLTGQLVVAAPGQVPPAAVTACTGGAPPLATWLMVLSAAGQTLNVPMYLVSTTGTPFSALGPAYVQVCLPSPYVPADQGGATFGAQLVNAEFSVQGVFGRVAAGAFLGIWTPWTPGTATVNVAATVASPAAVAPGAVTAAARIAARGAIVSGRVTQGGQPRGGVQVNVFAGARRGNLRRVGRVRSRANGTYTFRARTGTFFRANAVAVSATAQPLCSVLNAALQPLGIPCVNPTVNGFTAQSRIVRKRR